MALLKHSGPHNTLDRVYAIVGLDPSLFSGKWPQLLNFVALVLPDNQLVIGWHGVIFDQAEP